MKALRVAYQPESDELTLSAQTQEESWAEVCDRYDGDVHRVKSHDGNPPYNALYECVDEENVRHYYLVFEDASLFRERHKRFLDNLGVK